jgi:hypothetical protein
MSKNPTARPGRYPPAAPGAGGVSSGVADIVNLVNDASVRASAATPVTPRADPPIRGSATFVPLKLPRERRPGWATLFALATAAGLAAIGLGAWVVIDAELGSGNDARARETALESTVAVLASPRAVRVPLAAAARRLVLVVGERNEGVLLIRGLGRAAQGRTYQAWVQRRPSATPLSAGLFDGSEGVVRLTRPVTAGATVSVTVEGRGGANTPSRVPRLTAVVP